MRISDFLRPPGARPEKEFLALCLNCGQCAQACAYDCLHMDTGFKLWGRETPRIDPKQAPCFLCMRCCTGCPSGALEACTMEEARMGKAFLDRDKCYTWNGTLICRSCFERCPLKGRAMELKEGLYPEITDLCAGCGVCEHVCPASAVTTVSARVLS